MARPSWSTIANRRPAPLRTFADAYADADADITVMGALPAEFVPGVARAFEVPARSAESLTRLDATSFGLLCRGRVEYVSINPTPAEGRLLGQLASWRTAP